MNTMINIRAGTTSLYQSWKSRIEAGALRKEILNDNILTQAKTPFGRINSPISGAQRKEILNDNILTQEKASVEPTDLPLSDAKLKTKLNKPNKPFPSIVRNKSSYGGKSDMTVPLPKEKPVDAGCVENVFDGVCGKAETKSDIMTNELKSAHVDGQIENLQLQLNNLQKQVSNLTKELDHVNMEKLDVLILLEKLIRASETTTGLDRTKLEEVRMYVTAETVGRTESTLTGDSVHWFCSPCTGDHS
jgi:hypothetical protein